jgi:class 3 adenylate cyclase
MIESDRVPELGGETREVTIYLSDIAGFTNACEGLSAAETVRVMNVYFDAASETIEAFGGCVYMYIGDAIVAIFGAPLDDPHHARHAVEAALAFRDRMAALGPALSLAPGRPLRVRTGIATGPALIGNIGSSRRFNYTAMGDTVNLAARLENANKFYGTDILISGATASHLGDAIAARPIERVRVQGRDSPVDLYEPVGVREKLAQGDLEVLERFEQAARLRDAGEFSAARVLIDGTEDTHLTRILTGHLAGWERDPPPAGKIPVFDLPK